MLRRQCDDHTCNQPRTPTLTTATWSVCIFGNARLAGSLMSTGTTCSLLATVQSPMVQTAASANAMCGNCLMPDVPVFLTCKLVDFAFICGAISRCMLDGTEFRKFPALKQHVCTRIHTHNDALHLVLAIAPRRLAVTFACYGIFAAPGGGRDGWWVDGRF